MHGGGKMLAIWLVSKWWLLLWVPVGLCLPSILIFIALYLSTKNELDSKATDMYECKKHGLFPKDALLYYEFPEEGKETLRIPRCPMCMHEDFNGLAKDIDIQRKKKLLEWKDKSA